MNNFNNMRKFVLNREVDASGVSGTGIVAEGVEFSDGTCAMTWLTPFKCCSFYASIKTIEHIHGHGSNTKVVFDSQFDTLRQRDKQNG